MFLAKCLLTYTPETIEAIRSYMERATDQTPAIPPALVNFTEHSVYVNLLVKADYTEALAANQRNIDLILMRAVEAVTSDFLGDVLQDLVDSGAWIESEEDDCPITDPVVTLLGLDTDTVNKTIATTDLNLLFVVEGAHLLDELDAGW